MSESIYQVIDGMYRSPLFLTLADAERDVAECVASEGHSGSWAIIEYQAGDSGSGYVRFCSEGTGSGEYIGHRHYSETAREWCVEMSTADRAEHDTLSE